MFPFFLVNSLSSLYLLSHDDHAYDERLISTLFIYCPEIIFSLLHPVQSRDGGSFFTFCMIDIPGDSSRRFV